MVLKVGTRGLWYITRVKPKYKLLATIKKATKWIAITCLLPIITYNAIFTYFTYPHKFII